MADVLTLSPKLDLAAASALMTDLQNSTSAELTLDMSEVKHFGALCMQVILAAATSANADGRKISITNPSDRVVEQMRVMGMTPETISGGRK